MPTQGVCVCWCVDALMRAFRTDGMLWASSRQHHWVHDSDAKANICTTLSHNDLRGGYKRNRPSNAYGIKFYVPYAHS